MYHQKVLLPPLSWRGVSEITLDWAGINIISHSIIPLRQPCEEREWETVAHRHTIYRCSFELSDITHTHTHTTARTRFAQTTPVSQPVVISTLRLDIPGKLLQRSTRILYLDVLHWLTARKPVYCDVAVTSISESQRGRSGFHLKPRWAQLTVYFAPRRANDKNLANKSQPRSQRPGT